MTEKSQNEVDDFTLDVAYNEYLLALHSKILSEKRTNKSLEDLIAKNEVLRKEKLKAAAQLENLRDRCKFILQLNSQLLMLEEAEQFCKEAGAGVCKVTQSLGQLHDILEQAVNFLPIKNMKVSDDSIGKIQSQLAKLKKILDDSILQNSHCLERSTVDNINKIYFQTAHIKDDLKRCEKLLQIMPELIMRCYGIV